MELCYLYGSTWYFPGRVNVGFFRKGDDAWIVDSGIDDESGRKLARYMEDEGIRLRRIVTTHSNADHCGGNASLIKRTGCGAAATALEAAVIETPWIEPLLLWGAMPFKEIQDKFLQAKPSSVDLVVCNDGVIDESGLRAVPLPGHFLDMIGVRTPDDVFFIADALFSSEVVRKYGIMFVLDVKGALATFDMLEGMTARWFVPSHAPASEDIGPLVRENRRGMLLVSEMVYECCAVPSSREAIVSAVTERLGVTMTVSQCLLNSAAVGAHLTWLAGERKVAPEVVRGVLLWRRT